MLNNNKMQSLIKNEELWAHFSEIIHFINNNTNSNNNSSKMRHQAGHTTDDIIYLYHMILSYLVSSGRSHMVETSGNQWKPVTKPAAVLCNWNTFHINSLLSVNRLRLPPPTTPHHPTPLPTEPPLLPALLLSLHSLLPHFHPLPHHLLLPSSTPLHVAVHRQELMLLPWKHTNFNLIVSPRSHFYWVEHPGPHP